MAIGMGSVGEPVGVESRLKMIMPVELRASLIKQMIIPVFTSADDLTAINEQGLARRKREK